jgi:predicted Zn-ribbon and HTH transcriptional regulator
MMKMAIRRTPEQYHTEIFEKGFTALEVIRRMSVKAKVVCNKCGYEHMKKVQSILRGYGCAKCEGNAPLTTDEFRSYMAEKEPSYTLLSEVTGAFRKCTIRCEKGHEYEAKPINFVHKGRRCPPCHYESIRGEGHWNYNPNLTQEERETMRAFTGYDRWQQAIKARDKYTCQCCGDKRGGNLVSHHLNGWNIDKENRLNLDNGVTLCESCHKDFHSKYGYGGNTKQQYDQWMGEIINGEVKETARGKVDGATA